MSRCSITNSISEWKDIVKVDRSVGVLAMICVLRPLLSPGVNYLSELYVYYG